MFPPRRSQLSLHGRHNTVDISCISSILRLGDKYHLAPSLLMEAKNHLMTYYTTSFEAWADRCNALRWQPQPLDAIRVINLSRLLDIPSVLPTAFYICANIDPEELRYGSTLEDGSIRETLTPEDQFLVAQMRSCLVAENANNTFILFQAPRARIWPWKK
ncbi:hypothetical protein GSI_04515 [Ganoderma sinense ZZ0214-1]|uniref:Uncharacterized protein n=1 Tax=Ganoderma sinense ZZ0214-1 TaxID=1077348 RepID=A0A2G8SH30_9APHY|nr:hypothetical protein GSI_04515 [Ganoderma sinense ZZ0214-1]